MTELEEWNAAVDARQKAKAVTIGEHKPPTYRQLSLSLWLETVSAAAEANPPLLGPERSSEANG
jgi:hypothetical protein